MLALAAMFFANQPALACTGGALTAKDEGVAVGRTLEFGEPLNSVLAVWPAGSEFTGLTSTGKNGLKWKSKYGFAGPTAATNYDMLIDGLKAKASTSASSTSPASRNTPRRHRKTRPKASRPPKSPRGF